MSRGLNYQGVRRGAKVDASSAELESIERRGLTSVRRIVHNPSG